MGLSRGCCVVVFGFVLYAIDGYRGFEEDVLISHNNVCMDKHVTTQHSKYRHSPSRSPLSRRSDVRTLQSLPQTTVGCDG
jgi:hypothetical protein